MPTNTWKVTATVVDSVGDVTATHFDADGNPDATFSSRLKIGADGDIDKFVALAEEQLLKQAKSKDDSSDFAASIEAKFK